MRSRSRPEGAHLRSQADVAAYAAHRMPATYAAAATAMSQAAALARGFQPAIHLDAGGGTGAAIWAAGATWPSLRQVTVIERDPHVGTARRSYAGSPTAPPW